MPRGIRTHKTSLPLPVPGLAPLEATLDEIKTLCEARRQEYQASADRIADIIASMGTPKPRIGRPPKLR